MKALKEAIMKRRSAKLHDLHDGETHDGVHESSEELRSTSGLAPEINDQDEAQENEHPLAEAELEINPDENGQPMKPEMEIHGHPGLLEQMMKDVKGEEGKPTIAGKAAMKMKAAYEAMKAKGKK